MSNIKKHSKDGKKATPHLEYCHGVTVPLGSNPCTVIRHPIVSIDLDDELAKKLFEEANKENDGNYEQPVLNTLLALSRQMQELQLDRAPISRIGNIDNLSPRSKALVIPKISQKLNFPHDKTIFRNLISINVNDCNLLPKNKPSIRKKYIKSKNRAPRPDLGDFLDPIPPLEHFIPEPDIDLIYVPGDIDVFGEFCEFYRDVNPRWMGSDYEI